MAHAATVVSVVLGGCLVGHQASVLAARTTAQQSPTKPASAVSSSPRAVLDQYCVACHNDRLRTGGLAFDVLDVTQPAGAADVWKRVIAKLRIG